MFTTTLLAVSPPAFVQVRLNVLEPEVAEIDSDPLTFFVPFQSPHAKHDVAFVDVHDKVMLLPLVTVMGPNELFAFMVTTDGTTQDSDSTGLPTKDPQPFQSVHVLVCRLLAHVAHVVHCQLG